MATIKSEYYRFNGVSWDIHYFKTTMDMVDGLSAALAGKAPTNNATFTGYLDIDGLLKLKGKEMYIGSVYRARLTDFNTAITPGVYNFGSAAVNGPVSGFGWAKVDVEDNTDYDGASNWLKQEVQLTNGQKYYRYKINAGAFTSWYQIYTSEHKPTWADIVSKPSWIGASKPTYTWSEIGSKPTNIIRQVSFSSGTLVVEVV